MPIGIISTFKHSFTIEIRDKDGQINTICNSQAQVFYSIPVLQRPNNTITLKAHKEKYHCI